MLYKEYEKDVLERLQQIEREMLRDLNDFCRANDITYFGVGGTAIGAVRHGGFIPWDDDIDIGFLRSDYDRFLELAPKQLGDRYKIINAETDSHYPLMTTRFVKKGTKFKEECFKDLPVDLGIFLDLYCFDNIADDEKKMRRQVRRAWFWNKLMLMRTVKNPVLYYGGVKAVIVRGICRIGYWALHLVPRGNSFFYKRAKKLATKYANEQTKRVAYMFDPTPYTSICRREDIIPVTTRDFDGISVEFPGRIEAYLEERYGDYMQLPPDDKRHNHPPYELSFGDGRK